MVGQIKGFRFSNKFKKQYKMMPQEIQQAFNEKLALFLIFLVSIRKRHLLAQSCVFALLKSSK